MGNRRSERVTTPLRAASADSLANPGYWDVSRFGTGATSIVGGSSTATPSIRPSFIDPQPPVSEQRTQPRSFGLRPSPNASFGGQLAVGRLAHLAEVSVAVVGLLRTGHHEGLGLGPTLCQRPLARLPLKAMRQRHGAITRWGGASLAASYRGH